MTGSLVRLLLTLLTSRRRKLIQLQRVTSLDERRSRVSIALPNVENAALAATIGRRAYDDACALLREDTAGGLIATWKHETDPTTQGLPDSHLSCGGGATTRRRPNWQREAMRKSAASSSSTTQEACDSQNGTGGGE